MENIQTERESIEVRTLAFSLAITLIGTAEKVRRFGSRRPP
jgi:hypothetical protein